MSEKLCILSTGDEVYFYDKSIVVYFNGKRKVLSTSVYNGGYHEDYEAVYNYDAKQGSGMPCEVLADTYTEHMKLISQRLAINPCKVTGMGTAASMENAVIESMKFKELTVTAIVTGGIETNGGRVGDPADYYKPVENPDKFGTINIILILDCDMPAGTLARALVTCTEAKTAAIQELIAGSNYSTGIATGSGTDQTIVVANTESTLYLEGAGKHAKMGELIGKVVTLAVKKALKKQSGLCPEKQHDIFRRLKRYGVLPNELWKNYGVRDKKIYKPQYLLVAEGLAREDIMVTYTSLFVHLLDQFQWGLLNENEIKQGTQKLLDILSEHYQVDKVLISDTSLCNIVSMWSNIFNNIVEKRVNDIC